jgi:hypothetical protein
MATVTCTNCEEAISVDDPLAGQRVSCPRCGQSVSLPSPVTAALPGLGPLDRDLDSWSPPKQPRSDTEYVKQAVMAPAAAMQATGVIGGALSLFAGCAAVFGMLASLFAYNWRFERWMEDGGFLFFFGYMHVLASVIGGIVAFIAGRRMANLQAYSLVVLSCFILMVPILSPCWLIGIPVGIWALVVLNKDDVKAAFR